MTETERYVNTTCGLIVDSGYVRLYRDLYKDLRSFLPCRAACRLILRGLVRTRLFYLPKGGVSVMHIFGDRARAIAALRRLRLYAAGRERRTLGGEHGVV